MSPRIKKWLGALGALAMLSGVGTAHAANGLRGDYYVISPLGFSRPDRGQLFGCKNPTFSRVDPQVDFGWGGSAPTDADGNDPPTLPNGDPFPADGFAVRWSGIFTPDSGGAKIFTVRTDDGGRLYLKDKDQGPINGSDAPIADGWVDRGQADSDSAPITVQAGHQYYILMEFYENGGDANAQLRWRNQGDTADTKLPGSAQVIPSALLTPADPLGNPPADTTAPNAPPNLTATAGDDPNTSAKLTFTAPGNDGATGTAGCYEVRWSRAPITEANFSRANLGDIGTTLPNAGGTQQTITLKGLPFLDQVYVAIRAKDAGGNVGPISNVVQVQTSGTVQTPAQGVLAENFRGLNSVCLEASDGGLKGFGKYIADAPDDLAFYPHFDFYNDGDINKPAGGNNDRASNFGTRMRAIFTAPKPGDYTFYIAGDDDSELDISAPVSSGQPDISTLHAIAGNPGCDWDPNWAWGRHSDNGPVDDDPATPRNEATDASVSAPVHLNQGDKILIQALRQESGGGENLSVAAVFPDGTDGTNNVPTDPTIGFSNANNQPSDADIAMPEFTRPINGKYLTPYVPPAKGRIRGIVTDANNAPVWGASVSVSVGGGAPATATTDRDGVYSLQVAPGAAVVTAAFPVPWDATTGTANATVAASQIVSADVKINAALPPFKPAQPDAAKSDDFSGNALKAVWKADGVDPDGDATATVTNGMLELVGVGSDIWDGGDHFEYVHQTVTGDFDSVVHVINVPTTDGWSKVGIMARDSLDGIAHHAFAAATRDNGPSGQGRTIVSNADAKDVNVNNNLGGGFPQGTGYWMKLIKKDKKFYVYWSPDGTAYQYIYTIDFTNSTESPFATTMVGIAATTHDAAPADTEDPTARVDDFIFSDKVPTVGGGGTGHVCKGDANGAGGIDVSDAVAVLQNVVGIGTPLSGDNLKNADVNGDNAVDVSDAVSILQAIVGVSPGKDQIPSLTCP